MSRKVAYIVDNALLSQCNKLPTMLNRASLVQELIRSYGLLSNIIVKPSIPATEDDLKTFHSSGYIDFFKQAEACDNLEQIEEAQLEFGLGYDCPVLEQPFTFISTIAGGSLSAAKALTEGFRTAINWCGGWHHAQRKEAEGFCYVNDIVIAIEHLSKTYNKILYVDLDIHHGNGVQNAFEYSNRILSLSFHKYSPGFYPGSGSIDDIGELEGKHYSLNIPLLEGVRDDSYRKFFEPIFIKVVGSFKPDAIVAQCGADGLFGDPLGEANLTLSGMGKCIKRILECDLPTVFLGGGGYNFANTARYWTYLTSLIVNVDLPNDIPDNCENYMKYRPSFELHLQQGNRKDFNTNEYIDAIVEKIQISCTEIERGSSL